jgi:hypothetical protein
MKSGQKLPGVLSPSAPPPNLWKHLGWGGKCPVSPFSSSLSLSHPIPRSETPTQDFDPLNELSKCISTNVTLGWGWWKDGTTCASRSLLSPTLKVFDSHGRVLAPLRLLWAMQSVATGMVTVAARLWHCPTPSHTFTYLMVTLQGRPGPASRARIHRSLNTSSFLPPRTHFGSSKKPRDK